MKNKSFEEIKVSDICKEAHINRSTFYNTIRNNYYFLCKWCYKYLSRIH